MTSDPDLPNLRLTLQIDTNLTFGELYAFVDACRRGRNEPDETVLVQGVGPADEVLLVTFVDSDMVAPEPGTLIQ